MRQKTALVLGAGGFIGHHMVKRLKANGYWVRGVDLKYPDFEDSNADHFVIADLRDFKLVDQIIGYAGCARNPYQTYSLQFDSPFDEIYQFAADMGGAGYVFTGSHDADIMHNSATINLNVLFSVVAHRDKMVHVIKQSDTPRNPKIFYSSSACIYPERNQTNPNRPNCEESSAYPAQPDSEYGWEKLFSERLYLAFAKNYNLDIRIARLHNIFGPMGTWYGGKEKAPAAICRKVAEATDELEIWGDGQQTRSFLYIDDCIEAIRQLMKSSFVGPVNIGSEEMVTINHMCDMVCAIANKKLRYFYRIDMPQGVRGRNSDNKLIEEKLDWAPHYSLYEGLEITYEWIKSKVDEQNGNISA